MSVHDCIVSHGSSVPVPSRTLNTEVACLIFRGLDLKFDLSWCRPFPWKSRCFWESDGQHSHSFRQVSPIIFQVSPIPS